MKKSNIRKILSAFAVATVSCAAALSALPLTACAPVKETSKQPDKLISVDKTHKPTAISTATGLVQTQNSGKTYYVAPEGRATNSGESWESPIDITALLGAGGVDGEGILEAGDTVYVKPGTYDLYTTITMPDNVNGTYNNYIRVVNAALEEESGYKGDAKIVTLDFSEQPFESSGRGIQIYSNFVYWYGIDVCGAGDNGLYIGGDYNTVEYCEFYNNRDTGLQLGRAGSTLNTIDEWPSYNLVKNCTSHNNYDNQTFGENADGFAAKLTVGYGNVFDGCIAYRNSDDGWDLYAKTDTGNIGCIIIYNCVAFENGFLEYTQEECNAKFPTYQHVYDEMNTKSYFTRDGDGNGFKLGGSIMEGDVEMYNCLSFNNRMHGVTDNSNPGFLKVKGVTSYDNSAVVDDNTESPTYGQVIAFKAESKDEKIDNHANIDVARQTYSYNSVIDTISVNSNIAVKAKSDAYRGSVSNSVLSQGYNAIKSYVVEGSIDADTKSGLKCTKEVNAIKPEDVFKVLPVVNNEGEYTYNITGLKDLYASGTSGALKADRVHIKYRNADNSINMKDILAKKEGVDDTLLIAGKNIGSTLNLSSWEDYTHFYTEDFVNGSAASENLAKLQRALETLTINTDKDAVYQDFEVPVKLNGCTISWASSDEDVVSIGNEVEESLSKSQYITLAVYRPLTEPVKVTITATVSCGLGDAVVTDTKEFEITIMNGKPSVGKIMVRTQKGEVIENGGSYVVDWFDVFREPEVLVENGLDYNGKLLKSDQFTCETTYLWAADKSSPFLEIKGFTPSNSGVYMVTKTISLVSDPSNSRSMTYTMYVSSKAADVEFVKEQVDPEAEPEVKSSIVVNRYGYMISGELTNATGSIYAISSKDEISVTAENIKTLDGVKSYTFRGDKINYQFDNSNNEGYTVYYALANLNGEITSEVYSKKVETLDISTEADFMTVAAGNKIGNESPATTIYRLAKDLDFSGKTWESGKSAFKGLINGAGHTVKNVSVSADSNTSGVGLFYKTEGATIENIKFENISLSGGKQQVGIIAQAYGGYYHNIEIKNISITNGGQRSGGLIGHIFEYPLPAYISKVSVINDAQHVISTNKNHRAGGIVGFIQTTSAPVDGIDVRISDCYVIADISGYQQVGGIVGGYDNQKAGATFNLEITHCYFGGTCATTYSTPRVGGIIGYEAGAIGGFTIDSCISVGKLYYSEDHQEVEVALKSASLIVGLANTTAVNTVKNCIAAIEEYNSDFDVSVYSVRNMAYIPSVLVDVLGDAYGESWQLVYDETRPNPDSEEYPYYIKAPFLTLKHN
ncbi:MAG: right-handed parallel beta-helix repeat-containing protein [Clostridia bacterium]|nr:right-handed parallel beta-helix repeat-containing protein [Clostridia bacterium]